jgi:hypothetical protein
VTVADEEAAALIACLAYLETERADRGFLAGAPVGAAWRSLVAGRSEAALADTMRCAGNWALAGKLEALGIEVTAPPIDRGWKAR